jgi:hypothetical protein
MQSHLWYFATFAIAFALRLSAKKLKKASGTLADADQTQLPSRNRNAGYTDLVGKLLLSELKLNPDRTYFRASHVT